MGQKTSQTKGVLCEGIDPPHPMMNNTIIIERQGKHWLKSEWPFCSEDLFLKWKQKYQDFLKKVFDVDKIEDAQE